MRDVFIFWLFALVAMTPMWVGMVAWLFHRLRTRHPDEFAAIGSPSLFWDNSLRNKLRLLGFLYGGSWSYLDDPSLARMCRVMRAWVWMFALGFVGLMIFAFSANIVR